MRAVLVAALPFAVFIAIGELMSRITGRRAALAGSRPPNPKPLNIRLSYDATAMGAFFAALGPSGLAAERRFLKLDLLFPFVYATALATSLAWLADRAGYGSAIPIVIVIAGGLADWTENLVQLALVRRYLESGKAGLQPQLVRTASLSTLVKLIGVGFGFVLVLVLALVVIVRDRIP